MKPNLEKLEQYQNEGRGNWWFYPWWKKVLYVIALPFIMAWMGLCWFLMITARGLYQFGDFLSGWRWNEGDWSEEV